MNASTEAEKRQQARDLSGTLRAHREEILKRWAILCRQNTRAQTLTDDQLLDTFTARLPKSRAPSPRDAVPSPR
jgi:hypothetical protein